MSISACAHARKASATSAQPDVYVGHAGSRSFGDAKRALVLKNLSILDHRFPTFRAESSSFAKADPLRPARINIERLRLARSNDSRDVVSATDLPLAEARDVDHTSAAAGRVLVVIPGRAKASEFTLLRGLATAFFRTQPDLDIVVAGTTFDDRRLMSHPNVFVSGSTAPQELARALSTLGVGRILSLDRNGADALARGVRAGAHREPAGRLYRWVARRRVRSRR